MADAEWLTTTEAIERLRRWTGRRYNRATLGRWIRFGRFGDQLAARVVASGYRILASELSRFATKAGF